MNNQDDLPSDSDDSDVDYKPSDNEAIPSEEDSDNCVEEDQNDDTVDNVKTNKRKKKRINKKRNKVLKKDENSDDNDEEEVTKKPLDPAEEKKRADSLWADFMNDCGSTVPKKSSSTTDDLNNSKVENVETLSSTSEKENKVKVTEVFEFAGEKVCVEKEVAPESKEGLSLPMGRGRGVPAGRGRGRGGGIASILGQLGKKGKLSTLEKSKLDWEKFKTDEGIKEDIEKFNKGKDGYLERQDFLERSDLRQFEIEKNLRKTHRSNR